MWFKHILVTAFVASSALALAAPPNLEARVAIPDYPEAKPSTTKPTTTKTTTKKTTTKPVVTTASTKPTTTKATTTSAATPVPSECSTADYGKCVQFSCNCGIQAQNGQPVCRSDPDSCPAGKNCCNKNTDCPQGPSGSPPRYCINNPNGSGNRVCAGYCGFPDGAPPLGG